MTATLQAKRKRVIIPSLTAICCILVLPLMLFLNGGMKAGAARGLDLCLKTIIPTLFPFFILSDLWAVYVSASETNPICRFYEKLFGVSGATLPAYILGTICGFPLGIRTATRLYVDGVITKNELQRLSGFANNPSAAFVISGIGAGLYGDTGLGVLLYFCTVLSSILVGICFRQKETISENKGYISRQSFNLVNSIRSAGYSSLVACSYIIFFSAIIGIVSGITKNAIVVAITSSLMEITNAASLCANLAESNRLKYIITAFSLGFSGMSVHFQSFAILPLEISRTRYIYMKLFQGAACALIFYLLSFFI